MRAKKIIGWFRSRNYETCPQLDSLLQSCLDSGIKAIDCSHMYWGKCEFKNGMLYEYWNTNVPYAWLGDGNFSANGKVFYKYQSQMPSKKTMNAFAAALTDFLRQPHPYTTKHNNLWWWGQCVTIILNGGDGIVSVSVEEKDPNKAYIHDLSVIESKRRNGLGNALLNEALKQSKRMGCEYAELTAGDPCLCAWYERHGFKEIGFNEHVTYLQYNDLQNRNNL